MSNVVLFELEHNRSRLAYYESIAAKSVSVPSAAVQKWIEIYGERIQKIERQIQKAGLKTRLNIEHAASALKQA